MAKQVQIASLKDAGYRVAIQGEGMATIAAYVLQQAPNFLESVPDAVKEELYAGFQLRKHELFGSKFYKIGEANILIPLGDKKPVGIKGIFEFTVNSAMALTAHEFGQLRGSDPSKHAIIRDIRDSVQTYQSNRMKDLRNAIVSLQNPDKKRQRAVNKAFFESVKAGLDALEKKAKAAADRKEEGVDVVRFKAARAAFEQALKG